jgi:fucose permease
VTVLGLIAAIPLVIFAFAEFPKSQEADQFKMSDLVKVISNPLVFLLGAVLFFYVAVEISTVGWLKDYLINKFNLTDKTSGFVLTGFSSMMMVGRLSAGFILKKIRGVYLIVYCALLSVIGLAAMILTGNLPLTVLGVALTKLFFS